MSRKKIKKGFIVSFILVISIFLVLLFGFKSIYNKMNHTGIFNGVSESELLENEQNHDLIDSEQSEIDKANNLILSNLETNKEDLTFSDDVFNVLLIGSDERAYVSGSRSDSTMLMSINKKNKEIILTSFMRDMYVSIDGYKNNKLNAAYSFGGPELLIDTIEKNFNIKIDRYAQVDFFSFIDIVDALGGVDNIHISDDEMKLINGYSVEINRIQGNDLEKDYLQTSGDVSLNGVQALSYSRIRYVTTGTENNDFGRTQRQRIVLNSLFDKVKKCNIFELNELLNKLLPYITTNMSQGEFLSIILESANYAKYDLVSNRIPYDGTYTDLTVNKMSVLGVDFEKNIDKLIQVIYGEQDNSSVD